MDDQRIEKVLELLGDCIPRAPEKTVQKMIDTVNALEEKRTQMSAKSPEEKKPEREPQQKVTNKETGGPRL